MCFLSTWYFALMIVPAGLGRSAPTLQQGLFPEWYGSRAVLHRCDPYSITTSSQIQTAIYGRPLEASDQNLNQHRFAYPVFFAFLFLPIAVLPFSSAQFVSLVACALLTVIATLFWMLASGVRLHPATCIALVFASYPVMLALQLRQPTLMIAALLAATVYCALSGRLGLAGALAAFSTCKPQLAISILLPLAIWGVARWRKRRAFLTSMAATLAVLLSCSELVVRGWFSRWLSTVGAYVHYAGSRPLLADLLRGHLFIGAAVLLIAATVWVNIRLQSSDFLLAISFSISAFQLLFPFQIYNEVLLLPAALWIAINGARIRARGQLYVLLFASTWICLAMGWVSAFGLSLSNILAPGSGVKLWQLPLIAAWLYPFALFSALAAYAVAESRIADKSRSRPA
ncbi:MAG: glycosyltransferase family 87 protein [Candidatus Korobacteraceae bacterium]